jgi:hypothetical protein
MNRNVLAGACVALWLCGCSTLQGDFHQKLQIEAVDAQNHPVDGMRCQVGTGSSAKIAVTPVTEVRVRRSAMSLDVECRRDSLVATATVKPRRERMEEALLPFGSAGVFIDHFSGALYSYPTRLHLIVGQHLVLEHGGEAQIAKSEPILIAAEATPVAAHRLELTAVDPATVARARITAPAAAAPQKAAAAAPKTERTAAKSIKTASAPTAASKRAAAAAAVTAANVPAVRNAPTNW